MRQGKKSNLVDLARQIASKGGNLVDLGGATNDTWGNRVNLNRVTGGKERKPVDLALTPQ